MEIQVTAFTDKGVELSKRVFEDWTNEKVLFRTDKTEELSKWTKTGFENRRAIVFIGAVGIAVRSVAPFIKSKLTDSPVIVIDELGQYVIPILSGHVGGANELSIRIAEKIKAVPVITTATDINNKFAVDIFAKKNNLQIVNKDGIVKVSSKILSDEKITVAVEMGRVNGRIPHYIEIKDRIEIKDNKKDHMSEEKADVIITSDLDVQERAALVLRPKEYVLGIGCKKGKACSEIEEFIKMSGIDIGNIALIASVDRKKDESGIIELADKNRIDFVCFSPEELMRVEGEFSSSDFVKNQIGVDNVCERAAVLAAGEAGELVMKKQACNGITLALAKRKWSVSFDEK